MRSIKFENGDISIVSKQLKVVDGLHQKIQKTKGLLMISLGELFFNTEIGLDRTEVLSITHKSIPFNRKKIAITEAAMQDENVEKIEITDVKQDKKTRKETFFISVKYKDESKMIYLGGIDIE